MNIECAYSILRDLQIPEKDLKNVLQNLCDNKKVVDKYKKSAQEYILNKYNWDDVVDKTLELYK